MRAFFQEGVAESRYFIVQSTKKPAIKAGLIADGLDALADVNVDFRRTGILALRAGGSNSRRGEAQGNH